jgi:hypothetical protein
MSPACLYVARLHATDCGFWTYGVITYTFKNGLGQIVISHTVPEVIRTRARS